MKILVIDTRLSGHHLEYLHYYYCGALQNTQNEYLFCVPVDFDNIKVQYVWENQYNISFIYIPNNKVYACNNGSVFKKIWNTSWLIRDLAKKYSANKIILTDILELIPLMPFLLPSNIKVRGIMYKLYHYKEKELSKTKLIFEKMRLWFISKCKSIEFIYTLNDKNASIIYNKKFSSKKFKYIIDPAPSIASESSQDIRRELGISKDNKVFLNFGYLNARKGTLDILDSFQYLSKDELAMYTFIFAGKVDTSIRENFYERIRQWQNRLQIIIFDEFCEYELLFNLCKTCDIILIPYHTTAQSSGVIGYAAAFSKPVIGPNTGLVGNLIKDFGLGSCVEDITGISLASEYKKFHKCDGALYLNTHKACNFIHTLFSDL